MPRSVTVNTSKNLKDGVADLQLEFAMPGTRGCPLDLAADPGNIVASDAHVRMTLEYDDGSRGTSPWSRVVDLPSLSAQNKTDLRGIIKLIRDDIHTAAGATGTPDDV